MRQMILDTINDMVLDFLYYDRKGDSQLPLKAIEESIAKGEITVDEIVAEFRRHLLEGLKQ